MFEEELVVEVDVVDEETFLEAMVPWCCLKKCYFDVEFNADHAFLFRSRNGLLFPGTVATKAKLHEFIRLEQMRRSPRRTNEYHTGEN